MKKEKPTPQAKFLASGSYGCVFSPAISCPVSRTKGDKISKLFFKREYSDEEYEIQKKIVEKIDPKGKFTVKFHGRCAADLNQFPITELTKCGNLGSYNDNNNSKSSNESYKTAKSTFFATNIPTQIVYDNGGGDLSSIIKSKKNIYSFDQIIYSFKDIVDGLCILDKKGYAHLDIKPDNIVFNPITGKSKLIDFGMCREITSNIQIPNYIINHIYPYYPPEFINVANQNKNNKIKNYNTNTSYLINSTLNAITNKSVNPSDFEPKIQSNDGTVLYIDKRKIDVYSLGAIFFIIYNTYVADGSIIKYENQIISLIAGMIDPNPYNRFDAKFVKKMYTQIIKSFPKPCPAGKQMNPDSKRCIKIKK